mmetsp:Transcript_19219/g.60143  ORF Transcript_19219/g.60143 Transcript_19219/m.60143 type:complete len:244 (-) Transcript_19219:25-756(-)
MRAISCLLASAMAWDHLVEIRDPHSFPALMHAPPAAADAAPRPLLLYLHGAGEMGDNLADLISEGATGTPPVALEKGAAIPELHQFVVVAPQTSYGWEIEAVRDFVRFLLRGDAVPPLDASRLYVTGHSMGGTGALRAVAATKLFAACAPVAPAGGERPQRVLGTPVWAFHGRNDAVVPWYISENLVKGLRKLGAADDDAKLTIYEEAPTPPGWPNSEGHASTIPAYSDPALYAWLLGKRREG